VKGLQDGWVRWAWGDIYNMLYPAVWGKEGS